MKKKILDQYFKYPSFIQYLKVLLDKKNSISCTSLRNTKHTFYLQAIINNNLPNLIIPLVLFSNINL